VILTTFVPVRHEEKAPDDSKFVIFAVHIIKDLESSPY
jgi:hypothetical protein